MLRLTIRRTLSWVSVSFLFLFLAAQELCSARLSYARGYSSHASVLTVPGHVDLLMFAILALAAAAAAVAVRMVRRWH